LTRTLVVPEGTYRHVYRLNRRKIVLRGVQAQCQVLVVFALRPRDEHSAGTGLHRVVCPLDRRATIFLSVEQEEGRYALCLAHICDLACQLQAPGINVILGHNDEVPAKGALYCLNFNLFYAYQQRKMN
jgi:hypothetical protein